MFTTTFHIRLWRHLRMTPYFVFVDNMSSPKCTILTWQQCLHKKRLSSKKLNLSASFKCAVFLFDASAVVTKTLTHSPSLQKQLRSFFPFVDNVQCKIKLFSCYNNLWTSQHSFFFLFRWYKRILINGVNAADALQQSYLNVWKMGTCLPPVDSVGVTSSSL